MLRSKLLASSLYSLAVAFQLMIASSLALAQGAAEVDGYNRQVELWPSRIAKPLLQLTCCC